MDLDNNREHIGRKVAWLALISNLILTIGKLTFGLWGDSESVFADGIHSAADVFASIAVLAVIGIANKPPDRDHPFGHGKAEVITEAMVGVLLFLVSVYIVVEAILTFFHEPSVPGFSAFFAALGSFFVKEFLYHYSMGIGKRIDSKAIIAIAYDHKADIIASLAASLGVLLSIVGEHYELSFFLYADPVASVIVAILIFKIAKDLIQSSTNVLMEKNVDEALLDQYRRAIENFEQVKRIDHIRARDHGHYILLDVRLSLDHNLTIEEGHNISHQIRTEVQKEYPKIKEVFIHVNPYFEE